MGERAGGKGKGGRKKRRKGIKKQTKENKERRTREEGCALFQKANIIFGGIYLCRKLFEKDGQQIIGDSLW